MDFGQRIERGMAARGFKTNKEFANAAEISPQYVTNILRSNAVPALEVLQRIAAALRIDTGDLLSDSDERFLAALESPDPTAPDPEPPEDRVAGEHRGAFVRSLPIESFMHAGGLVDGSLAIDAITRPSGKSGELLKKRHAQRSDRKAKTPVVEIEGIPDGYELVRAEATVEIRDQDPVQIIPKGFLLVVDRATRPGLKRAPEPGQLVIGVRNVDQRITEEMPAVRLLRYHQAGRGWSLAEVDGSDKTYGSGDGWEVFATVRWWRSPP